MDVSSKTALVTGAGSGICLSFTQKLLSLGCNVVLADISLKPEAEETIAKHPDQALFIPTDVTSWAQLQSAFDQTLEKFKTLDIVVPGAGIFEPPSSSFWARSDPLSSNSFKTLEINLTHPIRATQLAFHYFLLQKLPQAVILHISSVAAQVESPALPLYVTSKAGLSHFVRTMKFAEESLGVRVMAVAPGHVKTTLWKDAGKEAWVDERDGDVWIEVGEVADFMIQMLTSDAYKGGSVWEVFHNSTREVKLVMDPGPDKEAPGHKMHPGAVEMMKKEMTGLIEENFGK